MMNNRTSIVVTSIYEPNQSVIKLAEGASANGWNFIIIGDSKTPVNFHVEGADFFDLKSQKDLDFKLAPLCPEKHYTRKNIGYLLAMRAGSEIIVETDDDNIPLPAFWSPRENTIASQRVSGIGWTNIYNLFSETGVWPRGIPLEEILSGNRISVGAQGRSESPIQQGLADGNPDVDAVFRMTQKLPLSFDQREYPVRLQSGLWCPFNSQNTTWFKEAFYLLYLPSFCTFRMTDIWRSLVAQRIAWECEWEIVFHNATVYQERNEHNLLQDFEQEVPGYLLNNKIRKILENAPLRKGKENIAANMMLCYEHLISQKVITDRQELSLLTAWISDVQKYF